MRIPAFLSAGLLALGLAAAAGPQPLAQGQQTPPPPAGQQQPPAQDPQRSAQPPIRSGINFVRVDVIVSDRDGNPVLDLKPEEFSVSEDGKPQKIETFSVVKIDQAAQIDAPTPLE